MLNATETTQNVGPTATGTGVGVLIVVAVLLCASVASLLRIWTRPEKLTWRLIWSLVVLAPFLGPLFYAAFVIMYPPSPNVISARPTKFYR
jgi:hypothetical protein